MMLQIEYKKKDEFAKSMEISDREVELQIWFPKTIKTSRGFKRWRCSSPNCWSTSWFRWKTASLREYRFSRSCFHHCWRRWWILHRRATSESPLKFSDSASARSSRSSRTTKLRCQKFGTCFPTKPGKETSTRRKCSFTGQQAGKVTFQDEKKIRMCKYRKKMIRPFLRSTDLIFYFQERIELVRVRPRGTGFLYKRGNTVHGIIPRRSESAKRIVLLNFLHFKAITPHSSLSIYIHHCLYRYLLQKTKKNSRRKNYQKIPLKKLNKI